MKLDSQEAAQNKVARWTNTDQLSRSREVLAHSYDVLANANAVLGTLSWSRAVQARSHGPWWQPVHERA